LEKATLLASAGSNKKPKLPVGIPSRRAAAIPIRPRVSINQSQGQTTIIEVEGRDRPGLLYALAKVLSDHDLSVRSAHIEVAGPKAIDVFYVEHKRDIDLRNTELSDNLMGVLASKKQSAA